MRVLFFGLLVCLTAAGCGVDDLENRPPLADAGPDQNVMTGTRVILDGSGSRDVDGGLLTCSWSFVSRPDGSSAVLSDAAAIRPAFTADAEGNYVLQLIVHDGAVASAADTVTVTATLGNAVPIADAGPDQNVTAGALVTMDGSASSDANGDLLSYAWSFVDRPGGSSAALSDAAAVRPTFTADAEGGYVLQLIVHDGAAASAADTVTVTATLGNAVPIADAGPDQSVILGSMVTLDGSGSSDADGDPLSYAWSFVSRPGGNSATLSGAKTVRPTFTPLVEGTYVLRLTVHDGAVASAADTVTVTVTRGNAAPVANAGPDQNVALGSLVTLDGSGSSDADGDPLSYAWSFVSRPGGSNAGLSSAAAVRPTFTADVEGNYVLQLIVNDGQVSSAADRVTVTATPGNVAPVAEAGPSQNVVVGNLVTLDGSGSSDADGDPLSYAWSFVSRPGGSNAGLSDATAVDPTFTPDVAGDYVLRLVVSDGTAASAADTVTVKVRDSKKDD